MFLSVCRELSDLQSYSEPKKSAYTITAKGEKHEVKQLMVILLDGIGVFACLFLEAYCVDSYIDGNRVYYNNYYNEAPFIILFITCGIVISLFCYIVKVLFEYLCLLD